MNEPLSSDFCTALITELADSTALNTRSQFPSLTDVVQEVGLPTQRNHGLPRISGSPALVVLSLVVGEAAVRDRVYYTMSAESKDAWNELHQHLYAQLEREKAEQQRAKLPILFRQLGG